MKPFLIIYHKDCLDGMAAAWVAARYHQTQTGCAYEFHASHYNDPIPDLTDRDVCILDFSYPPEVLLPAAKLAKSIVMIDHHDTAILKWKQLTPEQEVQRKKYSVMCIFGTVSSGAVMTWRYYNTLNDKVPEVLLMCQDHDLWKFEISETKAFVAGIFNTGCIANQDHDMFSNIMRNVDQQANVINDGKIILQIRKQMIENIIRRNLTFISTRWGKVPIANVPYDLASDFAEAVRVAYPKAPFVITYEDWLTTEVRKFSIRNDKNSYVNVGDLAEHMGGGGRAGTGGFTQSLSSKIDAIFSLSVALNTFGINYKRTE